MENYSSAFYKCSQESRTQKPVPFIIGHIGHNLTWFWTQPLVFPRDWTQKLNSFSAGFGCLPIPIQAHCLTSSKILRPGKGPRGCGHIPGFCRENFDPVWSRPLASYDRFFFLLAAPTLFLAALVDASKFLRMPIGMPSMLLLPPNQIIKKSIGHGHKIDCNNKDDHDEQASVLPGSLTTSSRAPGLMRGTVGLSRSFYVIHKLICDQHSVYFTIQTTKVFPTPSDHNGPARHSSTSPGHYQGLDLLLEWTWWIQYHCQMQLKDWMQ